MNTLSLSSSRCKSAGSLSSAINRPRKSVSTRLLDELLVDLKPAVKVKKQDEDPKDVGPSAPAKNLNPESTVAKNLLARLQNIRKKNDLVSNGEKNDEETKMHSSSSAVDTTEVPPRKGADSEGKKSSRGSSTALSKNYHAFSKSLSSFAKLKKCGSAGDLSTQASNSTKAEEDKRKDNAREKHVKHRPSMLPRVASLSRLTDHDGLNSSYSALNFNDDPSPPNEDDVSLGDFVENIKDPDERHNENQNSLLSGSCYHRPSKSAEEERLASLRGGHSSAPHIRHRSRRDGRLATRRDSSLSRSRHRSQSRERDRSLDSSHSQDQRRREGGRQPRRDSRSLPSGSMHSCTSRSGSRSRSQRRNRSSHRDTQGLPRRKSHGSIESLQALIDGLDGSKHGLNTLDRKAPRTISRQRSLPNLQDIEDKEATGMNGIRGVQNATWGIESTHSTTNTSRRALRSKGGRASTLQDLKVADSRKSARELNRSLASPGGSRNRRSLPNLQFAAAETTVLGRSHGTQNATWNVEFTGTTRNNERRALKSNGGGVASIFQHDFQVLDSHSSWAPASTGRSLPNLQFPECHETAATNGAQNAPWGFASTDLMMNTTTTQRRALKSQGGRASIVHQDLPVVPDSRISTRDPESERLLSNPLGAKGPTPEQKDNENDDDDSQASSICSHIFVEYLPSKSMKSSVNHKVPKRVDTSLSSSSSTASSTISKSSFSADISLVSTERT